MSTAPACGRDCLLGSGLFATPDKHKSRLCTFSACSPARSLLRKTLYFFLPLPVVLICFPEIENAQLLNTVMLLQNSGVTHNDLAPGNIMLEALPDGRLKVELVDLGLAQLNVPVVDKVSPAHAQAAFVVLWLETATENGSTYGLWHHWCCVGASSVGGLR